MPEDNPEPGSPQDATEAAQALAAAVLADTALKLGETIPEASGDVWRLLWSVSGLRFRVGMALADASMALASRRLQVLLPKDPSITELDRTTTQAAGSATQEALVQRLELAMTLLNSHVELLRDYIAFGAHPSQTEPKED